MVEFKYDFMWYGNFQLNIGISCKFVPLCSSCYIRTE